MKKKIILAAVFCFVALPLIATGYTNPILPGMHPDPSICRVGGDYYIVNSSFQFFPGIPVSHSRDLVHWQQIGNVLTRPSQVKLKNIGSGGGIYAPTIRYNKGKYYVIVTNVSGGGNFICTATNPAGEWSEPIFLKQGGIDPSLYFEDGKCYMVSTMNGRIMLCEINPDTGEQLTGSRPIWEGTGGRYTEGPHIYKINGYYYLMVAEGGTRYGHKESIARSRHIFGPYESNPDNPILSHENRLAQSNPIQGTGHADLVQAQDSSWWAVCLGFRTQGGSYHNTGRETYLAPVTWNKNGWPVVNGNGTISLDMNCATLPECPMPVASKRDDFDTPSLDFGWRYICIPRADKYSYNQERRGFLRLQASTVSLSSNDSPVFIGKVQQNPVFTATALMDFSHLHNGSESGMSVYMDGHYRYDISVENENGKCFLAVKYYLAQMVHTATRIPITEKNVYLRVSGTKTDYHFAYSTDGTHYTELAAMASRLLSTEVAGGFTGVTIGLFAQEKEENQSFADFDWFDYE